MANPPHLFGADGRLDERVLTDRALVNWRGRQDRPRPPLVLCRGLFAEDLGHLPGLHAVGR
jgi:hypothetical protein